MGRSIQSVGGAARTGIRERRACWHAFPEGAQVAEPHASWMLVRESPEEPARSWYGSQPFIQVIAGCGRAHPVSRLSNRPARRSAATQDLMALTFAMLHLADRHLVAGSAPRPLVRLLIEDLHAIAERIRAHHPRSDPTGEPERRWLRPDGASASYPGRCPRSPRQLRLRALVEQIGFV